MSTFESGAFSSVASVADANTDESAANGPRNRVLGWCRIVRDEFRDDRFFSTFRKAIAFGFSAVGESTVESVVAAQEVNSACREESGEPIGTVVARSAPARQRSE
jgi:hypothetical protein